MFTSDKLLFWLTDPAIFYSVCNSWFMPYIELDSLCGKQKKLPELTKEINNIDWPKSTVLGVSKSKNLLYYSFDKSDAEF